jgi:xanthine dehydrogenase accessory factor
MRLACDASFQRDNIAREPRASPEALFMHHVLQQLSEAFSRHQPVAFTALVETRGSTPQKAGATMLVFPDGSQVGTLGGGCVEAEVKRRALRLLDDGKTELLTFNLDSDYGWDDGLICGGRMKMLVDPVRGETEFAYYRRLLELLATDQGCTEAVILDSEKAGGQAVDRFLLDDTGEVVARSSQTAAAEVPPAIRDHLRPLVQRPRPYVAGGVSYLPHLRRCRLVIVGAGHVGQKVAELAAACDFDVWAVDDREQYCNPERFPLAKRLIVGDIDTALSGLEIDHNTYCLIVTRGHNHDEEALYRLAETSARYVGLIGSHRKIKMIFEDLLREGISREALARVYAPLGFDIGSQTVPEIAVSIVAELIAHRNLGELPERYRRTSLIEEVAVPST